jgi:phosphopantothenoylcysteine decarboxylase/phosphopantothenate--cysteine ligase
VSGPCAEAVDDIRILTTRSTGGMGRELALQAFRLGAEVTVVHAGQFPAVRNVAASSAAEMRDAVHRLFAEESFDYYLSPAAISDYAPIRVAGKIPSGQSPVIRLTPLPKILAEVVERYHPVTLAFKLGGGDDEAEAMLSQGVRMVVCDTAGEMGASAGSFVLLTNQGRERVDGSKQEVARRIWSALR